MIKRLTFGAAKAAALAALLAALCWPAPAQQRPRQSDRLRDDLAGAVKSVTVSSAPSNDRSRKQTVETSTYTRDGALSERVFYVDGAVAARVAYHDDAAGFRHASSTSPSGLGYGVRGTRLQPAERPASPFVTAADGTFTFVVARVYDTAGRLIGETVLSGDDPKKAGAPVVRLTYRYDDKSRMSEMTRVYGTANEQVDHEVYRYDDRDHVIEAVHYRASNSMPSRRTYAYEFDEHGNWSTRAETETLGGIPVVTITTRAIVYY
jgi:hypothetical protein